MADKKSLEIKTNENVGEGTKKNPYKISTSKDLQNIQSQDTTGKYYKLTNDIDLSDVDFNIISFFRGDLNGNGYKIRNLKIESRADYVGLIGTLTNEGVIKNLGLESANISASVLSNGSVGGLVGYLYGTIENCYSTGEISHSGFGKTGGLVGYSDGIIENCYSISNVFGETAGGLVGILGAKKIIRCSYAAGAVSGTNTGGLVGGSNVQGHNIENSYYDKEVSGQADTEKGTGRKTKEMKSTDYPNWDTSIWNLSSEYPTLK